MDRGRFAPTEEGTPQGGVISPLLLNIALHGVEQAAGTRPRKDASPGRCRTLRSRSVTPTTSSCSATVKTKRTWSGRGWTNGSGPGDFTSMRRRPESCTSMRGSDPGLHSAPLRGEAAHQTQQGSRPEVPGAVTDGDFLPKLAWTGIVRHRMVKGTASPDDPSLMDYWHTRRRTKAPPPMDKINEPLPRALRMPSSTPRERRQTEHTLLTCEAHGACLSRAAGKARTAGVRREALRCIPDPIGRNLEECFWVT